MRAFVTGSTGLLGSNLTRLLVEQGYQVKALVRSIEKGERFLGDLGVELIPGDMRNVAGFADQLRGCEVLFHVAAYFREYYQPGEHDDRLHEINVNGTLNLLSAALEQGITNVIYTSSGGVLGHYPDGRVPDESVPYAEDTFNLYFQSKIAAEKAIFKFLPQHPELRLVLILPGAILGPGDSGPTTSGQLIIDFMNRNVPISLPGGLTFVDARDVAQSMNNAITTGESGERFIVDGTFTPLKDVMALLERVSGVAGPRRSVSYPVAMGLAGLMELFSRLTGKPPLLTRQAVRTLQHDVVPTSAKAQQQLGFTTRPLEATLRDEINWFREHEYV